MELRERDFDAFFRAPFDAYGDNTPYVSPMRTDFARFLTAGVNPLFPTNDHFTYFTAHRDDRVLGRITAHMHAESNALYNTKLGYFGYFDCADDPEAAAALLGAAESWARAHGFDSIAGNFNLTAMQQIGVTTEGFDKAPYVDQVYSPPHIARLLEANGYTAEFPMRTFEVDLDSPGAAAVLARPQNDVFDPTEWTFATITRNAIPQRLEEARQLLNDGFAKNPMFAPLSKEEFDFQAKELKWIIDPRITAVIHHKGDAVGVALIIPDLNPFIRATGSRLSLASTWHYLWHRLHRDRALVVYASVRSDTQGKGLMGAMLSRVAVALRKAGYRKLGITWVWDGNVRSLKLVEHLGAKPLHRMHLYRKTLT